MRIAVYGAGGVGGYFGGRLAQAGTDVRFIDRGPHLRALREHGLRVRSVEGDFMVRVPATDDPTEVGPCDYVLFCVKAFDTEPAAARLGPLLGEGTAVLSLQNGVDNEDKLTQAIGQDHVMGGAAFVFAGKAEPGVIVYTGGPTSITFGELDGRVSERARRLLACCQEAGFSAETTYVAYHVPRRTHLRLVALGDESHVHGRGDFELRGEVRADHHRRCVPVPA